MTITALSRVGIVISFVFVSGCVRPAIPPPPREVRTVAVLPPNNRTPDDLLVAGTSMVEKYALRSARVTVPDVLADEAEDLLRTRGYRVTATSAVEAATSGHAPTSADDAARLTRHAGLEGFVLYLEIRRWEPDAGTHPEFVIVGVSATLLDATTGREIWSARPPVHPVATPGAVLLGSAYEIAAREVIAELLASWPS
jgi:hypothetical protein